MRPKTICRADGTCNQSMKNLLNEKLIPPYLNFEENYTSVFITLSLRFIVCNL